MSHVTVALNAFNMQRKFVQKHALLDQCIQSRRHLPESRKEKAFVGFRGEKIANILQAIREGS